MSQKKCVFNKDWINPELNPDWSVMFSEVNSNMYQVFCRICSKVFELSNMGRQAITSHLKSIKQKKIDEKKQPGSNTLNTYFSSEKNSSTSLEPPAAGVKISNPNQESKAHQDDSNNVTTVKTNFTNSLSNFVLGTDVIDAEILWCLNVTMCHMSFNSCKKSIPVMQKMFKDSKIAEKITLGPTKAAYTTTFGLAPFFKEKLLREINFCDKCVVCFDESLNKVSQKGQMDIVIRFWNISENLVQSRYLTSVFLQHATASDILSKFKEGIAPIPLDKLLQVSMDGPNVNWLFYDNLKKQEKTTVSEMIELGSCGLHILHGALQTGHKIAKWKFCATRWVEGASAANRALEIIDDIAKYVNSKQVKLPINISCSNVKNACADGLIKCKLAFFSTIATNMEPFLTKYQTSNPMAPFIYTDMEILIRGLILRFVKSEIAEFELRKLIRTDFDKKEHLKPFNEIDIGYSTRKYYNRLLKNVTEREKQQFLLECQKFLQASVKKILERSSLKYPLTKAITCFNPKQISASKSASCNRLKNLLQILHNSIIIDADTAEKAQQQYEKFVNDNAVLEMCKGFSTDLRLDEFFKELLSNDPEYSKLWQVAKYLVFSVNKQILVENLHEESLVAQRLVYDTVLDLGGVCEVNIDQKMRQFVRNSNRCYKEALEKKKTQGSEVGNTRRQKDMIREEIKQLKRKKHLLNTKSTSQSNSIDLEIEILKRKINYLFVWSIICIIILRYTWEG
ncbi:hypothetical protein RI129_003257 [Pyrocoelia pectoralis]|uniref:Uncharacterized protein n=1 Tax=Pyrocoelia pectoralis TaxID=417401 RepID=A0AAN7ZIH5_9COLE